MLSLFLTFLVFTLQPLGLVLRDFNAGSLIILRIVLLEVRGLETLLGNGVELIFLSIILNLSASGLFGRS